MRDHIQIINSPNFDTERYLLRLVEQIHVTPELQGLPVQLLTRKYPDGLPASLDNVKVIHRAGAGEDAKALANINIEHAKYIVILARDGSDSVSDSVTFDILSRVVKKNTSAIIIVEAVLDDNRERFLEIGATAVLRPIRAYPEMIARTLAHPGTEQILEDLFDVEGDSLSRVECTFDQLPWTSILSLCVEHNIGTPLGYFSRDGKLVNHPAFDAVCTGKAIVVLVKENQRVDRDHFQRLLNKLPAAADSQRE